MATPAQPTSSVARARLSNDRLYRQVDELHTLSADYRREFLGEDFFQQMRDLYTLSNIVDTNVPSFRPRVTVPQLQMLTLNEASDLADMMPKIYLVHDKECRNKARESALQAEWRQGYFNLEIMYATIWAMLAGTGFIQVGFDPTARRGMGRVWIRSNDPESIYPDPASMDDVEWYYCVKVDRQYPEEIVRRFPAARRLLSRMGDASAARLPRNQLTNPGLGYGLKMPPGPMRTGAPLEDNQPMGPGDGRWELRYLFVNDPSAEDIAKAAGGSKFDTSKIVPARFKQRWPDGRLVVECEGEIIFDDHNPFPKGQDGNNTIPYIRICALPPLTGFWAPPPTRFTRDLQYLAQRMLTQVFENAVRLNNGVWFIDESTGLSAEDFGGIPAEVRVINANSRYPELRLPKPFPTHMLEYPKYLLALQKELAGFSQSRQGETQKGNIASDLFDASVFQSQAMTRMRAKLLAQSVQRVAEQVFYLMATYYPENTRFPNFGDKFNLVEWGQGGAPDEWNVYLDPGSIRPVSSAALKRMVPALKQSGMLDTRTALEWMDVPGAQEIAENIEAEKALEALARIKRR